MLKEVAFTVPGAWLLRADQRFVASRDDMEARSLGSRVVEGVAHGATELRGSGDALRAFAEHAERGWEPTGAAPPAPEPLGGPHAPLLDLQVLHTTRRRLVYAARWRRPAAPGEGVSMAHLAHDHLGPGGLLFTRVVPGALLCIAGAEDGPALGRLIDAVRRRDGARDGVRVHYAGPFRGVWGGGAPDDALQSDDARLASEALARGYYDTPKGCGVRELAECLGVSKSAVARRLREVERRALTALVDDAPTPPGRSA